MRISKKPFIGVSVLSLVLGGLSVLGASVAGATVVPTLSIVNVDTPANAFQIGSTNVVTLTAGVSSTSAAAETQPITVTDTIPTGVTPSAATGSGWTCTVTGQVVSCVYSTVTVPIGSTLPSISISVSSPSANLSNTATASSSDGTSASATTPISNTSLNSQYVYFTSTPPTSPPTGTTYTVTTGSGTIIGTTDPVVGGPSGIPVTLSIDNASTSGCTISNSVVTFAAPVGTCIIDANEAGNSSYNAAAQVQQSMTTSAALIPQVIAPHVQVPSSFQLGGNVVSPISNTPGGSGNPVVYSKDVSSTSGCTVSTTGSIALIAPAGTCVVDLNQAGNATYSAAPQVQATVNLVMGTQTLTFTSTPPTAPQIGATYTPVATSATFPGVTTSPNPAGGPATTVPIIYTIDKSSTSGCAIASGVVTFTAPTGTCVIDANQAANTDYAAATQVQQTITTSIGTQTLIFKPTDSSSPQVGTTYSVSVSDAPTSTTGIAAPVPSTSPIVLTVDKASTSGCTITSNPYASGTTSGTVTLSAPAGTCIIDANQAANPMFTAAVQVQQTVASVVSPQVIHFTSTPPSTARIGSTYVVTATGGGSGNPVVFTVDKSSTSGCTVTSSGLVTLKAPVGTCVIDATQSGNTGYATASQATQTLTLSQTALLSQKIVFTHHPAKIIRIGDLYMVAAKGGASRNPVVFSKGAGSTSGCVVSKTGLVAYSPPAGRCIINANQAGNSTYSAAPRVSQMTVSSKRPSAIHFVGKLPVAVVVGSHYRVAVMSNGSTSPIIISKAMRSTSGCVVAKNGDVVFKAPMGMCIVQAIQGGNAKFLPARVITHTFQVTANGKESTTPSTVIKRGKKGKPVVKPPVAKKGKPVIKPPVVASSAAISTVILYPNGASILTVADQQVINKFAEMIKSSKLHNVTVTGYASNSALGAKRAGGAAAYLFFALSKIGYTTATVRSVGGKATPSKNNQSDFVAN